MMMDYPEIIKEFSRLRDVAKNIDPDSVKYGQLLPSLVNYLEHTIEFLSSTKLEDLEDEDKKKITAGPTYVIQDNKYLRESVFGQELLDVVYNMGMLYRKMKKKNS
jgi:hypothetical protein